MTSYKALDIFAGTLLGAQMIPLSSHSLSSQASSVSPKYPLDLYRTLPFELVEPAHPQVRSYNPCHMTSIHPLELDTLTPLEPLMLCLSSNHAGYNPTL
jgi:hypothetical protein